MLAIVVPTLWAAAALTTTPPRVPDDVASHVRLEKVATGLHKPVGVAFAPGDGRGRMFVVEQEGTIRIVEGGAPSPEPFLDLRARVSTNHPERGLLGLAFHPDFAKNGKFYVDFTDVKGNTNVVEFRVDPDRPGLVDLKSERRVFYLKQPYANHNGGNLVFGPDEKLWIGTGDGGSGGDPHGNGQNDDVLLGKMLRLDVNAGGKDAKPEIWAKGLRNPWRYAFDPKTKDLYIADVGQDRFEEVDVVASTSGSLNFGWNRMEATHCFRPSQNCDTTGLTLPVVEYSHKDGCSITGGAVYRGKAIPSLDGVYFYSDYCTAFLRSFRYAGPGESMKDAFEWRPALDPHDELAQVTAFGQDPDGELYVVSHTGTIWKLVPAQAPVASPAASPTPSPKPRH